MLRSPMPLLSTPPPLPEAGTLLHPELSDTPATVFSNTNPAYPSCDTELILTGSPASAYFTILETMLLSMRSTSSLYTDTSCSYHSIDASVRKPCCSRYSTTPESASEKTFLKVSSISGSSAVSFSSEYLKILSVRYFILCSLSSIRST